MGLFQHPHLTRGLVKTAKGAFSVSRGLVEMPDEIGESLGWRPVDRDDDAPVNGSRSLSPDGGVSDQHARSALTNAAHVEQANQVVHQSISRSSGLTKSTK
jgi:hypothetical protein